MGLASELERLEKIGRDMAKAADRTEDPKAERVRTLAEAMGAKQTA